MENPSHAVTRSLYLRDIASPALRAARSTECEAIRGRSIPVDRSTDKSTDQSEWAGMELLTQQLDCRYMDAFYAELEYAARNRVLREGAWQLCLQLAPVHGLKTALDLATYMQCLHAVRDAPMCQAADSYSVTGACAEYLRTRNWAQWGLDGGTAPRAVSLFVDSHQRGVLPLEQRALELPAHITLAGQIRTGFFFNCCSLGMGFVMPFSYLHLPRAVTVSDHEGIGTVSVQDIELGQDVASSLINKPVNVSCDLDSGITGHYALSVYCHGTALGPAQSPAK